MDLLIQIMQTIFLHIIIKKVLSIEIKRDLRCSVCLSENMISDGERDVFECVRGFRRERERERERE